MTASSIHFKGKLIRMPGVYSQVDAEGLQSVGLGASGIVALIGSAVGGRPVADIEAITDLPRYTNPAAAQRFASRGDLKEAAAMAFSPSGDAQIQGGAAEVLMLKVNPATKASATLQSGSGPGLVVTSGDWGEFSNQISVSIQDGTHKGKLITATYEDTTESVDDVGGDAMLSLSYRPPEGDAGQGYSRVRASLSAAGLSVTGALEVTGADAARLLSESGDFTAQSTSAEDTSQTLTVVGLDAGAPRVRSVLLTGDAPVEVGAFDGGVFGAYLSAACAGTVELSQAGVNLSIAPGEVVTGGAKLGATFVDNAPVELSSSGAGTEAVYLVGQTALGETVAEAVTLNGTVPVSGVVRFVKLFAIITSAVPAASTVHLSAAALSSSHAAQDTLLKLSDLVNARQLDNPAAPSQPFGFSLALSTKLSSLSPANLDPVQSLDILHPLYAELYADGFFIAQAMTSQFSLVDGSVPEGATGVPDNTGPVYLSGGSEGVTRFSDWQAALNLLKQLRVSTIVPLTANPAVHAALAAHIDYMAGKNERDGIVGGQNASFTGPPTRAELVAQISALDTRHLRYCAQNVDRYNTAGERQTFPPYFAAVLAAGMQAGSEVGVALTHKVVNCLGISQDKSWNPVDDAEYLLAHGLCFMEQADGIGRRWVRNITTCISSDNSAHTEASINEAVNFTEYTLRTNLEFAVGQKGFVGTINAVKGIAMATLSQLVDANIITAYRNLIVTLDGDRLDVEVELAPVSPINFVVATIHLVAQQLAA